MTAARDPAEQLPGVDTSHWPEPSLVGVAGRAWRRQPQTSAPACLGAWVVHRPGAHPWWPLYLAAVIHLRDEPGLPEPVLESPRATHELSFQAFHPARRPAGPYDELRTSQLLVPPDLVYQFAADDELAKRLLNVAVMTIVQDLRVSPDVDFRSWWQTILSGTLAHLRADRHPEAGRQ